MRSFSPVAVATIALRKSAPMPPLDFPPPYFFSTRRQPCEQFSMRAIATDVVRSVVCVIVIIMRWHAHYVSIAVSTVFRHKGRS